jgi:hypothetical protein
VAVGEPVARDEDVGDQVLEAEVCVVGFRAAQAELRQHDLDEMRIKRLENDVSAGREEGGGAKAGSGCSAATHMSHGPGNFTKGLILPPRHCLNSASHLGSLAPPDTTAAQPYVASNIAAARWNNTGCRGSVSLHRDANAAARGRGGWGGQCSGGDRMVARGGSPALR